MGSSLDALGPAILACLAKFQNLSQTERQKTPVLVIFFKLSNPLLVAYFLQKVTPSKPITRHRQLGTKCTNAQDYGGHLIQTTTTTKDQLLRLSSVDENGPHNLIYLNAWSSADRTVWKD